MQTLRLLHDSEDPAFVLGGAPDMGLTWGAILEIFLIIANIATALTIYPVLKRRFFGAELGLCQRPPHRIHVHRDGHRRGFGPGCLAAQAGGADPAAMTAVGQALVALHDWTFKMGPGVVVGFGNGIILGYMMWKTRLLPRFLSILGLIGGPALLTASTAVMFGYTEIGSTIHGLLVAPEFFWELLLGIWLLVRGFNPLPLQTSMPGRREVGRTTSNPDGQRYRVSS